MDTKSMAEQERLDHADLLASLSPEQWDAPTLCSQWRVRDVVAHVVSYDGLGPTELAAQFVPRAVLAGPGQRGRGHAAPRP